MFKDGVNGEDRIYLSMLLTMGIVYAAVALVDMIGVGVIDERRKYPREFGYGAK